MSNKHAFYLLRTDNYCSIDFVREYSYKNENLTLSVPFVVKKAKNGYMAECLDLNIVTQGKNLKEAKVNIKEAINLHMKSASELGIL